MSKILSGILLGVILGGLFPSALYAESRSASFSVSVTIPERIQLASPARPQGVQSRPETLLLSSEDVRAGQETNLGSKMDACMISRSVEGRLVQVFTLTAI